MSRTINQFHEKFYPVHFIVTTLLLPLRNVMLRSSYPAYASDSAIPVKGFYYTHRAQSYPHLVTISAKSYSTLIQETILVYSYRLYIYIYIYIYICVHAQYIVCIECSAQTDFHQFSSNASVVFNFISIQSLLYTYRASTSTFLAQFPIIYVCNEMGYDRNN